MLIEKASIGQGSTAANTGLLQYANDTPLYQFIEAQGKEKAVRFYRLCQSAVEELGAISLNLRDDVEYACRDSLYYASTAKDVFIIEKEYEALKTNGFPVDYLVQAEIRERFGFTKAAALLTHGGCGD